MASVLRELRVRDYRCLKDVHCQLTPLHAFIGPNDSGKSTLLDAIGQLFDANRWSEHEPHMFAMLSDASKLWLNWPGTPGLQATIGQSGQIMPWAKAVGLDVARESLSLRVGRELRTQLVRLNADELRLPSALIPEGDALVLHGRGGNIAGLYDALRDRSLDAFSAISAEVVKHFPTVQELGLRATKEQRKVLNVTLKDGTKVAAAEMSEGLLYFLAFAILGALQRPAIYLIEEPETGLHPSRIKDIVEMLRVVAEDPKRPVQVLVATHSPLVINELKPEEVTIVTRDPEKGTRLTPMTETANFAERSKTYALGELWLSYADGRTEASLVASGK